MKRASFWRAGAFLPFVVAFGCERFSGGEGGEGTTASTTDTSTSSKTTGTETATSNDASSSDTTATSSGTESTSGTGGSAPTIETVTVVDAAGAAVPNARLVINDAAGDVVDDLMAMADGTAMVDIPDGGSVTYLAPPDAEGDLWSYAYLAVSPGSSVKVTREVTDAVPANLQPQVTFTATATNIPAGTSRYRLHASCLKSAVVSVANPVVLQQYRGCPGISGTGLLLVAHDASDMALEWEYVEVALPASSATPTISLTKTTFERKPWNVLSGPTGPEYELSVVGRDTSIGVLADSVLFAFENKHDSSPLFASRVDIPTGIDEARVTETIYLMTGTHAILRRRVSPLENLAVPIGDWTPTTPSTLETPPTLLDFTDTSYIRVNIDVPMQPPPSDVVRLQIGQDLGGGVRRNYVVHAPAATASRVIPLVPADAAPRYPTYAGAQLAYSHYDVATVNGYDAVVAQGFDPRGPVGYSSDEQLFDFTPP